VTTPGGAFRPRVLYVDDDAALCRLVAKGLERRGFDIVAVQDALEAVEMAAHEAFDAIAIDHYMPRQTGLDTLAQFKDRGLAAPVIYVTASDEIQIAISALRAGASDYVIKSGSEDFPTLLGNSLDHVLAKVSLQRDKEAAEAALRAANERLEAIVSRQAALLGEVNHRVANSLQLVSSLVYMQASALADGAARTALADTQARINAIMQIHRRLYTSDDVQFVDMEEYLRGLVDELEQSTSSPTGDRRIRLAAEPIKLQTDKAVSLGVVVTELVTNALKYAYPGEHRGEVRIALAGDGPGRLRLTVEDDGAGMPKGAAAAVQGTGLGQKVIAAMARSLDSRVELDPAHLGVRASLSFSL
jgi:two-component sensor histidine kinase/CheY-like chemotaxis protein